MYKKLIFSRPFGDIFFKGNHGSLELHKGNHAKKITGEREIGAELPDGVSPLV